MKAFFSEFKFVILFLVLVTMVSGFSNLEVAGESTQNLKAVVQAKAQAVVRVEAAMTTRSPASVKAEQASVLTKNFFCNHSNEGKSAVAKVTKNLVMVNFKLCKDVKTIESVTLKNETNGFKAQVFQPDPHSYKTDYIQLSDGSNNIVVEVVLKDGQINRESLVILTGS